MVEKVFYYFRCKVHGLFSFGVSCNAGETPARLTEANCPICGAASPREHLR